MKHLTKKILAALIAVALVFTLVACSNSDGDDDNNADANNNSGLGGFGGNSNPGNDDDNDADNSNDDADANSGGGLGGNSGGNTGGNNNTPNRNANVDSDGGDNPWTRLDDGTSLFLFGVPTPDEVGVDTDTSVANGKAFAGKREIVNGWAIFTVTTEGEGENEVWFNICLRAPEGAIIDGAPGGWNLREAEFLPEDDVMLGFDEAKFLNHEATWGKDAPAMFAGYTASKGEVINLLELHEKLRADGAYITMNPNLQ